MIYAFTAQNQTITYEIAKPVISADYETLPGALTGVTGDLLTQISQESGLGSPPTATVVVIGSGESAPASVETCSVTIQAAPPIVFNCQVEDSAASFNGSSGAGSATVGLSISEDISAGGSANPTPGFSLGLSYDGQVIDATGVTPGCEPFRTREWCWRRVFQRIVACWWINRGLYLRLPRCDIPRVWIT